MKTTTMPRIASVITTMIGVRLIRKSLKLRPQLAPIRMFGGSPISVAVPPIFEKIASRIRIGTVGSPSSWVIRIVTGAIRITVVTLSMKADTIAVASRNSTVTNTPFPLVCRAICTARYSNTPVVAMMFTMIIMPTSSPSTFRSTLPNMSLNPATLNTTISPAPSIAAIVLSIFSDAIAM